jgi:hypothetical protein
MLRSAMSSLCFNIAVCGIMLGFPPSEGFDALLAVTCSDPAGVSRAMSLPIWEPVESCLCGGICSLGWFMSVMGFELCWERALMAGVDRTGLCSEVVRWLRLDFIEGVDSWSSPPLGIYIFGLWSGSLSCRRPL